MGMTAPAAHLLLSQFPPATARLYAEYRRLRQSLPPAEARRMSEGEKTNRCLRPAGMMTAVRLRVRAHKQTAQICIAAEQKLAAPCLLHLRQNRLQYHSLIHCQCLGSILQAPVRSSSKAGLLKAINVGFGCRHWIPSI